MSIILNAEQERLLSHLNRRRPRVSAFVLDAYYALTWCFPDRATTANDETLRRLDRIATRSN